MKKLRVLLALLAIAVIDVLGSALYLKHCEDSVAPLAPPLDSPHAQDALVVFFGGFKSDYELTDESKLRAAYAATLYRENLAPKIFAVGGSRDNRPQPGSALIRNYLVGEMNVPKEVVRADKTSYDTLSNWRQAKRIAANENDEALVLVSSALHLYRIWRIVRDDGYPYPIYLAAHDIAQRKQQSVFSRLNFATWKAIHHEWLGIAATSILSEEQFYGLLRKLRRDWELI